MIHPGRQQGVGRRCLRPTVPMQADAARPRIGGTLARVGGARDAVLAEAAQAQEGEDGGDSQNMTHYDGVRLPPVLVVEFVDEFGVLADPSPGDVLVEGAGAAGAADEADNGEAPTVAAFLHCGALLGASQFK